MQTNVHNLGPETVRIVAYSVLQKTKNNDGWTTANDTLAVNHAPRDLRPYDALHFDEGDAMMNSSYTTEVRAKEDYFATFRLKISGNNKIFVVFQCFVKLF